MTRSRVAVVSDVEAERLDPAWLLVTLADREFAATAAAFPDEQRGRAEVAARLG